MIARGFILAGSVTALLIAGLGGLVLFGCVFGAVFLLGAAVWRGWYR